MKSSTGLCKLLYPKAIVKRVIMITYLYSGDIEVGDEVDLGN